MSPRATWTQPRLIPHLPTLVKAELTLHYDGPRGTLDAGYRIRSVTEDELLAMGAFPVRAPGREDRTLESIVAWIDGLVHTHLAPF